MSRFSNLALLGTSATAAAVLALAPAAQAAGTSMNVSATGVTVSGLRVTGTYAAHGVQGLMTSGSAPDKGRVFANPGPMNTEITYGDGSTPVGTNGAGGSQCTPEKGTAPLSMTLPMSHTYAEPGTYTITVKGSYCGPKGEVWVSRTYSVTVGTKATTPTSPAPSSPTTSAPASSSATPAPSSDAQPSGAATPAPTKVGPPVQTDEVAQRGSSSAWALAGFAGAGAAAGAGTLVARRRREN